MMRIILFGVILSTLSHFQSCKNAQAENLGIDQVMDRDDKWDLVWSDEFEVDGLPNQDFWGYDVADGCPHVCGWGNNELQFYTKADLKTGRVEDGHLIIEAHKKAMGGKKYTSARLVTREKNSWLNGKFEIRAKLPTGRGTWPAIWMMPKESVYGIWPKSGEIDIMEHVGYSPDSIVGTVHTEAFNHGIGTQVGNHTYMPDCESVFHTYSIEWSEKSIEWFIDGKKYHSFKNRNKSYKEWPFDQPFYLIMNIAVGGNWGGKHGVDTTIWPQRMVVDYVRVYEKDKSIND